MPLQASRKPLTMTSLDEIEGSFKRVRPALDVTAFGINARVFEPGQSSRPHWHAEQEEVFFVHRGAMQVSLDGQQWRDVPEGSFVRIAAGTPHALRNDSAQQATVVMVGGAGGIVEGDAHFVEASDTDLPWSTS